MNSEDPGTQNDIGSLFQLPEALVRAAFGGAANTAWLTDFAGMAKGVPPVGTGSILGSADCLAKCKLNAA
jgi:hypothetical protein